MSLNTYFARSNAPMKYWRVCRPVPSKEILPPISRPVWVVVLPTRMYPLLSYTPTECAVSPTWYCLSYRIQNNAEIWKFKTKLFIDMLRLTHLHVDKMAAILAEDIFKCVLFNENSEFKYHWNLSQKTNADPVEWRVYATLWGMLNRFRECRTYHSF